MPLLLVAEAMARCLRITSESKDVSFVSGRQFRPRRPVAIRAASCESASLMISSDMKAIIVCDDDQHEARCRQARRCRRRFEFVTCVTFEEAHYGSRVPMVWCEGVLPSTDDAEHQVKCGGRFEILI
jgi:hypothetical protein